MDGVHTQAAHMHTRTCTLMFMPIAHMPTCCTTCPTRSHSAHVCCMRTQTLMHTYAPDAEEGSPVAKHEIAFSDSGIGSKRVLSRRRTPPCSEARGLLLPARPLSRSGRWCRISPAPKRPWKRHRRGHRDIRAVSRQGLWSHHPAASPRPQQSQLCPQERPGCQDVFLGPFSCLTVT